MTVAIPQRFGNTGQESLRQCIYEREQRLLTYPQIASSSRHAIQTRSDPLFGSIAVAFTAGQFPFESLRVMNALSLENPCFFVAPRSDC